MHLKTRTIRLASIAAMLLLVGTGIAQAQSIKKYVTPDGRTIYSDVPVPGAREVGKIAPPPPPIEQSSQDSDDETADNDAERARQLDRRMAERSARQDKIKAAEAELESARETLANGKDPLPDERLGIAGGGTRLTEAYYQRQQNNESAVKNAEQMLQSLRAKPE